MIRTPFSQVGEGEIEVPAGWVSPELLTKLMTTGRGVPALTIHIETAILEDGLQLDARFNEPSTVKFSFKMTEANIEESK